MLRMSPLTLGFIALVWIVFNSPPTLANTTPPLVTLLEQAKSALKLRDFKQVKTILSPHEYAYGGEPTFDYFIGTAFLELKEYGKAIFALERAVAVSPRFAGAKFELARAHFFSENYPEAKKLFEELMTLDPPKKLKDTISTFLRVAEKRESQFKTMHSPEITFNFGYDSNANSAPDIDSVLGLPLAEKNKETASDFLALHLTDTFSMPIFPDWRWQSQGSIYARHNTSANFVDMQLYILQTGLHWDSRDHFFAADLGGMHSNVDGEPLSESLPAGLPVDYQTENLQRNANFVNLMYGYKTQSNSSYSVTLKMAEYRHEPILRVRDMSQYLLDFGYTTQLSPLWQLTSNLITAHDSMDTSDSPYANDRYGIGLNLAHPFYSTVLSNLNLKYFNVDYEGSFLGETRDDTQLLIEYSVNWLKTKKMSYWAKLSWLDNDSSHSTQLYSYQKSSIEFGINYQF